MSASSPSATTTATPHPPPFQRMDTLPKTQRGLNKPKCIQCGNVARSRCPYRSCKSCCSKAQNPCHIHVLKSSSAFPEKPPTSSTPSSEQKSTQASSQVTPLRAPSFRQLSNAFAQFDNLQVRTKKHLTRKDAIALNEWRYSKLKEFKDGNIEIENDAFNRYMQNISLLEEVFSIKSMDEGSNEDGGSKPRPTSKEDKTSVMSSGLKLTLKSDPVRTNNARKRIKQIVDQGIEKLQRTEANDGANVPDDQNKLDSRLKKVKSLWVERASVVSDVVDKLNKARNEEDLKYCLEMKAHLYNQSSMSSETETKGPETFNEECTETPRQLAHHLLTRIEIDQETVNKIDAHFSTVELIEDL
ncbi:putative BOI-related E3 ubiquitin-protein ligase 2-like [Hibiscus syriacus]|uniref:BOI-related E3 ubiquitin-protein ligase 2-like n=1 Tax=Hibiscus syriacus TaxID=106335 RepID=A0A6A2XZX8_HIBSY|nr:uncharacterized protein LOC120186138 [Hibiscus syriacus]KAE8662567.1 putative BOI-related E3 ubiquitin-protein ligase 2-like [Hibiscus syriacus]